MIVGMGKPIKNNSGFTVVKTLVVLGLVCIIAIIVLVAIHSSSQTYKIPGSAASTNLNADDTNKAIYNTLSPATVPSKAPECSQTVAYTSDGNSSPLTCGNGYINIQAWNSLSALEPQVMKLGYAATATQVQATLCADVRANIKNDIEESSYEISSLYYGWSFSTDPSAVIKNGTCVNVDD
jgi:hypothetical protein